jgi:two-component system, chemotaxis family, sensor kinase Cph1
LMNKCRDEKAAEQVKEVADIILRSSFGAVDLINNLLGLAKAGQAPKNVSMVNVRESVERVLEEKTALIKAEKIKVILDDDLGRIVADPTHIYQLFTNLIGNAIEYNDNPDPEIGISYEKGNDGTHIYRVWDNGPGISPDDADKVFQPLYSGRGGGTGIGLATVKKIVDIYAGDIGVHNHDGACFKFTLKDFESG